MKLLTNALRKKLPPLRAQEDAGGEAVAYVKFFTPDAQWSWHVLEASGLVTDEDGKVTEVPLSELEPQDEQDVLFFGLVDGMEKELGYFRLSELQEARGPWGLPIERDRGWGPKTLEEIAPELYRSKERSRS
jgi:hypothetical protein